MLRVHFTAEDLVKTRLTATPDPLWKITSSLHRLQTQRGRWAYADWFHSTRIRLTEMNLTRAVRNLLIPLFPYAPYLPDFLTPAEAGDGLEAGLTAIKATSPERVQHELEKLDRVRSIPSWARRLVDRAQREPLTQALRAYHEAVIAPYHDTMRAHLDAERAVRARAILDDGIHGLLNSLRPMMRWQPPVLEVPYQGHDSPRDLHLNGRGLLFIPSYFCWQVPMPLADPDLPPVLFYPARGNLDPDPKARPGDSSAAPLAALIGRSRAAVLRATAPEATTSELARRIGISPAAASQHTTVLRDNGLITSHRHANIVLHTLTPLGTTLLHDHPAVRDQPAVG